MLVFGARLHDLPAQAMSQTRCIRAGTVVHPASHLKQSSALLPDTLCSLLMTFIAATTDLDICAIYGNILLIDAGLKSSLLLTPSLYDTLQITTGLEPPKTFRRAQHSATQNSMGSENRASFLNYMSELSVSASSAASASLAAAGSLSQTATAPDFTSPVTATNRTDSKTSTTADVFLTTNQSGVPNSASSAATSDATLVSEMAVHMELSTAAKAGIGVGISIAAVLLIGALILYLKSRTSRAQAHPRWLWQKETAEKEGKACLGPYQDETWVAGQNPDRMTEQEAMGIAELSSDSCTHELDGRSHMTPELDGEGRER
jgi:hypothetical protein